jgi:hypothetical protein
VNVHAADLVVAHVQSESPVHVDWRPTDQSLPNGVHAQHDAVLALEHLLDGHAALLERLHERFPEVDDRLRADADPLAGKLRGVAPHDIGMEIALGALEIDAEHCAECAAGKLHVCSLGHGRRGYARRMAYANTPARTPAPQP